jgi:hypothetical protein
MIRRVVIYVVFAAAAVRAALSARVRALLTSPPRRRDRDLFGWDSWDDGRTGVVHPDPGDFPAPGAGLAPIPDDGWRALSGHPLTALATWQPATWQQNLPAQVTPTRSLGLGGGSVVPLPEAIPVPSGTRPETAAIPALPSPAPIADTSIDMDGWLIELLTCPPKRIKTAARQSWQRYEAQSRRAVGAYLTELHELAS